MKKTLITLAVLATTNSFGNVNHTIYEGTQFSNATCVVGVTTDSLSGLVSKVDILDGSYEQLPVEMSIFNRGYSKKDSPSSWSGVKEFNIGNMLNSAEVERNEVRNGYNERIEVGESADESGQYQGTYKFRNDGSLKTIDLKVSGTRFAASATKFNCRDLKVINQ